MSVAVVAVIAGYCMSTFDRTRRDAAAAAKAAADLGRLRWHHMITAVLLLAVVVACVRALLVQDGFKDHGPKQPAPSVSVRPVAR